MAPALCGVLPFRNDLALRCNGPVLFVCVRWLVNWNGCVQMSDLFMTCGIPGVGKSTFAVMAAECLGAIRLTSDEWLRRIHPDWSEGGLDDIRDEVEDLQWELCGNLLDLGVDVIMDWGFWEPPGRQRTVEFARKHGARVNLVTFSVDSDVAWARLLQRNANRGFAMGISERAFHSARERFTPPSAAESMLYDHVIEGTTSSCSSLRALRPV